MTKFRKSIIIFGCIILCAVGALVAFLTLSASGMIETDPIELTLTVQDNEKEYDGTPLTAEQYTLTSGKLLQGHKISVTYIGEQTEVGNGKSSLSAKILDEKERDVSKKYIIRVEGGELDVTMRSLVVTQKEVEREYTGEQVPGGDYTVEAGTSLCAGHRLVRSTDESGITNVGTGIDAAIPLVYDVFGNDVTGNYEIDYTPGKITVQPRKLEIAPIDATKEYDGTPLYADHRITYGTLLQGHRLNVVYKRAGDDTDDGSSYGLLQAGEAKIAVSRVTVSDENGNDVTGNYLITPSVADATLRVTKRALRVAGVGGSWVYDGLSHDTKDSTEIPEDRLDGLCSTDKIAVEYKADITNVGTKPNMYEVTVKNGGDDVTKSYSIIYTYDDLTVTARTVNLTLDRPSGKEYDGEPVSLDIVQEIGFAVQEGETIAADRLDALREEVKGALRTEVLRDGEEVPEVKDAGTYTYTVVFEKGENANFTLGNKANELRGNVVISPRKITVGLKEYSALRELDTYSGGPITVSVDKVVNTLNGFAVNTLSTAEESEENKWAKAVWDNNFLRVMTELTVFDAGDYAFDVEIAGTENFTFDGDRNPHGTFTILQRKIEIDTEPQIEDTYSGEPITIELNRVCPFTDSKDIEKLDLDIQNRIIDAGTYAYVVRPKDAKNYTLVGPDRGELVVKPREIVIILQPESSLTHTYGDIPSYTSVDDVVQNSITAIEQSKLTLDIASEIVNAGDYPFTVRTLDNNYTVSGEASGKVVVLRRGISLAVKDCKKPYDPDGNTVTLSDVLVAYDDSGAVIEFDTLDETYRNALSLTVNGKIADTGWYGYTVSLADDNYIIQNKIADGTTTDVMQLHDYLQITPLEVKLTVREPNATYNAEILTLDIADAVNTDAIVLLKESGEQPATGTTLAKITAMLQLSMQGIPKNAGDYPFTVRLVDPKNNYSLTEPLSGTYTIGQKTITHVVYDGETKVYDGQPLSFKPERMTVSAPDDIETLTCTSAVANFDDANVGSKKLIIKQLGLRNDKGEDVTQNYSFSEKSYTVGEITKRPLRIDCNTLTIKERDVENYTAETLQKLAMQLTYISTETPLVLGDTITIKWSVTVDVNYWDHGNTMPIQINVDGIKINNGIGNQNYTFSAQEDACIFIS